MLIKAELAGRLLDEQKVGAKIRDNLRGKKGLKWFKILIDEKVTFSINIGKIVLEPFSVASFEFQRRVVWPLELFLSYEPLFRFLVILSDDGQCFLFL